MDAKGSAHPKCSSLYTFFPIKPIEWDVGPVDVAAFFFGGGGNYVVSVCFFGCEKWQIREGP